MTLGQFIIAGFKCLVVTGILVSGILMIWATIVYNNCNKDRKDSGGWRK